MTVPSPITAPSLMTTYGPIAAVLPIDALSSIIAVGCMPFGWGILSGKRRPITFEKAMDGFVCLIIVLLLAETACGTMTHEVLVVFRRGENFSRSEERRVGK